METMVKFHTAQEVPSSELNAMQEYTQESLDRIARELLFDEGRYIGLTVTKTGPLNVNVAAGFYVSSGQVFSKLALTSHDLTSFLPSSNLRKVLVVVTGQEVETEIQTRRFLTDAATRATQPRAVATRTARQGVVDLIAGPASAAPSRPAVGAGWIVVAEMTVGPSGITVDPVMEAGTKAISLEAAVNSITLLEAQDRKFASMMETIRSDIAAVTVEANSKAEVRDFNRLIGDVKELRDRLGVPDTATYWGQDSFSSAVESDEAFAGYDARIEGGAVQFGYTDTSTQLTALANPADPKLDIAASGMILPASSSEIRIDNDSYDSQVSFASYGSSTVAGRKLKMSTSYIFYATKAGREFAEEFIKSAGKLRVRNPADNTMRTIDVGGKVWAISPENAGGKAWRLTVNEPYWDIDTVEVSTTGARIAQTFLCAQGGWHKRLDLWFISVGATGDVRIKVCGLTPDGLPDLQNIIADSVIAVASLNTQAWSRADFDPFWLARGRRYAIVITTGGNHVLGCSAQSGLLHGTLVAAQDGTAFLTDLDRDLMMRLYACKFNSNRVVVELGDISLAGGIREIVTAISGFKPAGTSLVMQARIAGVWRNLDTDDETVLSTSPNLVPLRLVFVGTPDMMPALDLNRSRVTAGRPGVSATHISTVRTLGYLSTTDSVSVYEISDGFVEADHNWTVTILHGAGYATEVAATVVRDHIRPDGRPARTWVFAVPTISSYRIKSVFSTSDATKPMSLNWRSDKAA